MNELYIITNEELAERGLDLNNYALDGTCINAIINISLDICITRICDLGDNLKGEYSVEEKLGNDADKIYAFKKLQYRVIHNLIFQGETSPTDSFVDKIISHELNIGKINDIQKGFYHRS